MLREALPDAFITASHDVSREQREYETHLHGRRECLRRPARKPRISNGSKAASRSDGFTGNLSDHAVQWRAVRRRDGARPVHPDAGVGPGRGRRSRAAPSGDALGMRSLICFDMGGTTAKACVLQDGNGGIFRPTTSSAAITKVWSSAFRCSTSRRVGTGGGSIAWINEAGGLHVGPQSAGASPGPACYGARRHAADRYRRASRARATSRRDRFLGGRMRLDAGGGDASDRTAHRGSRWGSTFRASGGRYLAIANATMANAVRAVTTERGLDPRDFALVAYGGAGPLHAVDVARELAIRTVIIPHGARALLGLRHADRRFAPRVRANAPRPLTRALLARDRSALHGRSRRRRERGCARPACRARIRSARTRRRRALRRPEHSVTIPLEGRTRQHARGQSRVRCGAPAAVQPQRAGGTGRDHRGCASRSSARSASRRWPDSPRAAARRSPRRSAGSAARALRSAHARVDAHRCTIAQLLLAGRHRSRARRSSKKTARRRSFRQGCAVDVEPVRPSHSHGGRL